MLARREQQGRRPPRLRPRPRHRTQGRGIGPLPPAGQPPIEAVHAWASLQPCRYIRSQSRCQSALSRSKLRFLFPDGRQSQLYAYNAPTNYSFDFSSWAAFTASALEVGRWACP